MEKILMVDHNSRCLQEPIFSRYLKDKQPILKIVAGCYKEAIPAEFADLPEVRKFMAEAIHSVEVAIDLSLTNPDQQVILTAYDKDTGNVGGIIGFYVGLLPDILVIKDVVTCLCQEAGYAELARLLLDGDSSRIVTFTTWYTDPAFRKGKGYQYLEKIEILARESGYKYALFISNPLLFIKAAQHFRKTDYLCLSEDIKIYNEPFLASLWAVDLYR
jgi:hypothetical protein